MSKQQKNPLQLNGLTMLGATKPIALTDLGNARRMVALHGSSIRFCFPWGKWLVWDGTRWGVDNTGEIYRLAKDTVRSIYSEASLELDPDRRSALAKHATKSEATARIAAMIDLAKSEPGVPILPSELDSDLWTLNCLTGTIDLRTGKLRPHSKDDLITKLCPVEYDPKATCPTWDAFLMRNMAGNAELITFLQRAIGYSATGSTAEECFFIAFGGGRNGKSKFLDALGYILGDYAQSTRPQTLMQKRNDTIPNDIAALRGARFVTTIETGEGGRLDEPLVKHLTGSDNISARFLHGEFFTFQPQFKIWLATNHKPTIRGTDTAIWERIHLIPFTVYIPPEERDKNLLDKFIAEAPGILRWLVEGCLAWQRDGLCAPHVVSSATQAYRAEMDILAEFIAEKCIVHPLRQATFAELYQSYMAWCETWNEKPVSQTTFGRRLTERGFVAYRESGSGNRYRQGITTKLNPHSVEPLSGNKSNWKF